MKKILLVYNPVAGDASFRKNLDSVIETFQRRDILLTIFRTCAKDSAEKFLESVKNSSVEGIIAAGGDGTLHAVVNWLKKFNVNLPVGIIGSGTSNDFARHLQLGNLSEYAAAVAAGKTRLVDLGLANGEYFVNVASAGIFTSIAHEVNARQKNSLGKLAYYLRGFGEIPKFKSVQLSLRADGKSFELEAFLFLVLNSPAVAGFERISGVAKVDDGLLDFVALKKCSPQQIISVAQKIFSGRPIHAEPNIFYQQAKVFEISSATKLISDFDGERGKDLPLKIENICGALNFFVR